jgi:plasmid replication initiation protein
VNEVKKIENKLVVQANSLIEASYKLKPSQQKFLRVMASIINKNDEDFKMYEFKISELIELFEVKDQSKYKEIPKQTRELMGNVLTFKTDKKIIQVPFLNYCEYELGEGILKVQFHPYLKPFYLYLSKENPYTKYELKNILPLKSVYSIRIYELLKQFEKIGTRTLAISQLREIFQIKPTEYTRYNDFKRFVLLQAQKEVPLKTDISFEFDEIKEKRKVTAIKFYIKPNIQAQNEISATQMDAELKSQKEKISEDEAFGVKRVKELINEHDVTELEALKILKSAKGDFAVIQKVYNHFKNKQSDNFVGLMVSMVKPGVFQKPKFNAPKTTFNDYEQRHYDYNELEKGLTGEKEINLREITSQ